jgi:predicted enzyme related to lactoylglutathione lyase
VTTTNRVNCFDFIEFPAKSIDDLQQSKKFYTSVFGWSYKDWGDDYTDTGESGLGSGINADPSHRSRYPLAVIYTDDLESVREKIIAGNGKITRDIFSFPGGRRFNFKDPAGNELAVWSDLPHKP